MLFPGTLVLPLQMDFDQAAARREDLLPPETLLFTMGCCCPDQEPANVPCACGKAFLSHCFGWFKLRELHKNQRIRNCSGDPVLLRGIRPWTFQYPGNCPHHWKKMMQKSQGCVVPSSGKGVTFIQHNFEVETKFTYSSTSNRTTLQNTHAGFESRLQEGNKSQWCLRCGDAQSNLSVHSARSILAFPGNE